MEPAAFEGWMAAVLEARGFDSAESSATASWARQTAEYEVETHGARKIFSLLDHEFARSGSCVPQAEHEMLLSAGSLEVWDGRKKLGPAVSKLAQARSVELAAEQGLGIVFVRDCNHFGWGPAYALEHLADGLLVGNITQVTTAVVLPRCTPRILLITWWRFHHRRVPSRSSHRSEVTSRPSAPTPSPWPWTLAAAAAARGARSFSGIPALRQ